LFSSSIPVSDGLLKNDLMNFFKSYLKQVKIKKLVVLMENVNNYQ
jgi:hypothetical protein